ncbi:MAG: putative DNA modification/repair radical SAM protein [Pedobacter sp.]|nr:putative DNA modification/repair radical SAM protein [Pedobacter sp.]
MNFERITEKLSILADAAKYDVSCSSSGSKRANKDKGLGNATGMGICHSYTEDGRCVSLLKILLTNVCIFDCAYCVTRKSNDVKRAAFTVQEVVDLTINFYRRNYIEGLFLSSGIFKDADTTMERLVSVAKKLRLEENFNGYIHLKSIPGASNELMRQAGLYADRLSINIELPTAAGLKLLAPDKNHKDMTGPMDFVKKEIITYQAEKKLFKATPKFAPGGQSTQVIIGATPETDLEVIAIANNFYKDYKLKRVYYSGYIPVTDDSRLPSLQSKVPIIRENRLYQADWLMRFYGFKAEEILDPKDPFLALDMDPKLAWALRNQSFFPINIQNADLEAILRVPGIGVKSAWKIVSARKFCNLNATHLKKMGVATNRASHFICFNQFQATYNKLDSPNLKSVILKTVKSKYTNDFKPQLSLF